MTLDEAINRYERQTEELYNAIPCDGCAFRICKEEHRQLSEWLKELKAYRKAHEEIQHEPLVWEYGQAIEKCLFIIDHCLREVNAGED